MTAITNLFSQVTDSIESQKRSCISRAQALQLVDCATVAGIFLKSMSLHTYGTSDKNFINFGVIFFNSSLSLTKGSVPPIVPPLDDRLLADDII